MTQLNFCNCGCNYYQPEVYLSVNKNRVRQRDGKAYLKNGTEFELEFNNKSSHVQKAVITINGKKQKHALVLMPGDHFYLDRFMDEKRKFLFDVFSVDDNEVVRELIEDNGSIQVEFFKEVKPVVTWTTTTLPYWYDTGIKYVSNSGNATSQFNNFSSARSVKTKGIAPDSFVGGVLNDGVVNTACFMSADMSNMKSMEYTSDMKLSEQQIETGRVEKGASSDQDFTTVHYNFEYWANKTVTFKILPISQMEKEQVFVKDIRSYCKCGRRAKKGWNVCPGCGQDLRSR